MMRSLYSAVSGLKTHQTRMDVIGNNIANVNTEAFKATSVRFSEIMYQTTSGASAGNGAAGTGGKNAKQIGLGVKSGATAVNITGAGSAETTGNPFDLRLNDKNATNFFVVSDGTNRLFTRAGDFYVDGNGYLCMSSTGYTLQGWQVDAKGNVIKDTVSSLQVMSSATKTSAPEATTKAYVSGVLDKNDAQAAGTGRIITIGFFDDLGYNYTAKFGIKKTNTDGTYDVTLKDIVDSKGNSIIEDETAQAESDAEEIRKPENVVSLLQVDPIELEFGYGIIPLADVNQGGDLLDRVVMIRRQIALELGTVVPIIRLRDNIQLNPNQYIIKIKGIQVTEGEILFDHYMAMNPGYVEEEITGIPTFEPSFHLPAIWITESQRERAESLGYTVVDPPSIIATHLTEVIRSHIAELLTRQDVQNLVNNLKESNPVIVDELIPKLLGLGEIQKVLQNLLSEGISIRDLLTIFETLADHAQTTRDTDVLTEYVRQGLKRAISSKYFPANETTSVITLDPAVEQEIMSSVKQTEQGSYLSLDPDRIKAIIKSVETEIGKLESLGKSAIIITSPIVRMYFKKMTEDYFKDLIVLSYNEVESNVELQSVGMVTA